MSWWLYLIQTDKGNLYTGITTDVYRRFQEHCDVANKKPSAKGAKFFRSQKPVKVIYQKEYSSRSEASSEEARIKKLSSQEKRKLLL